MLNQTQKTTLLVDMGNSAIKWALLDSGGLSSMSKAQYIEEPSSAFFTKCWQALDAPNEVIVSCVAENTLWQALEKVCNELWDIEVQKVTSLKEGFGLLSAYDHASSLGSDRWCAMLGGLAITDSAFMVIDAGSALTLDVVNKAGEHLGGYIVPGVSMMKQSLGTQTARIQTENTITQSPSLLLGKSTDECVAAGSLLSAISLIEAVFEKEVNPLEEYKVYITGGDAELIAGLLSFKCMIIPALVLNGLAVIAENNLKNN